LFLSGEDEPEHDGKTISEWLEVYQNRHVENGTIRPTGGPADDAIRAMGTNAMPYILAELRAEDSRLETLRLRLLRKQSLIRLRSQPDDVRRAAACGALMAADGAASGFASQLIELLESPDITVQYFAIMSLGRCESEEVAGVLVRQLDKDAFQLQFAALKGLGRMTNSPDVAIPALTSAIETAKPQARLQAVVALGAFGERANSAAPAVRRLLDDKKNNNWIAFARVLHSVDPENAHKTLVSGLIERLADGGNRGGQLASIGLLGRLGPAARAALPELRALLLVDDVTVQKNTKRAIREITGEAK
jgi:HEAT repeat protein